MLLIALLPSIVAATSILARPADGSAVVTLGTIDLDTPSFTSTSDFAGEACIGLNVAGDFVCHVLAQIEADKGKEFTIEAKDGVITKINFKKGLPAAEDTVTITTAQAAPEAAIKEPVQLVNNEILKDEPEKTFIQKYWMYIVPILLLLLLGGGAPEEGK
ncbi:hypothetical protein B0I72DRAFT_139002 [Yarrowia lipolytica]|jgi:hypothetical protein|uniref:YALI0E32175p n=2 Tax=Yarrowia lipolytica TaxID=4952 RepID=Q6C3T9_YARLI|nr:YALI0E32175p [Yarrowia lipolytica CLIB122]AOW06278.1 hypothetical protein YALI1_E38136g [Yarrowia lipolytica]KAB8285464.1 hypothetical protein BKA91DRAFT_133103 [Yarrowia lipolytica]KAE8175447.1 hypothetical protein BKA90DRAFT_132667 [Yarrowia lipolytica]KAJ8057651.1 hypothetical protein LXG23DRAFT_34524 [Yarrowia lipolytica]QNQ00871.1 Hypothetical protein YALI2_F00416g [Yarrowia lipolytica]|eukprot:XP_504673.2 YALI0E32175p [Yarrowia lipolytica CLIB122]